MTNVNMFHGDKDWIVSISAHEIFEDKITGWIQESKQGCLSKEDVLAVTTKVADYRGTDFLLEEIRQRLN